MLAEAQDSPNVFTSRDLAGLLIQVAASIVELLPLTKTETRMLIEDVVAQGNVQLDVREYADELHRMSSGNPRILEELLIELAARDYNIDSSFGPNLLDLDWRIHEMQLAAKAAAAAPTRK